MIQKLYQQHEFDASEFFQLAECHILEKPIFSKKRECCGVVPEFILYSEENNEFCEIDGSGFPIINKLF